MSSLEFQLHDVRFSDTIPYASTGDIDAYKGDALLDEVERLQEEEKCKWKLTTTIFGRTRDGYSVCVNIYGFYPELYYDIDVTEEEIMQQCQSRGKLIIEEVMRYDAGDCILDDDGNKIPRKYKRVSYSSLFTYRRACYNRSAPVAHHTIPPLESKFFVHTGLKPEGWVKLDTTLLFMHESRTSWCNYEYNTIISNISYLQCDEFAPLKICALDIEAVSDKEEFPDANLVNDVVCQISLVQWTLGSSLDVPPDRYCVCLKYTAPITGATVISCDNEYDTLLALRDTLLKLDPDIITTWNGAGFDLAYLDTRSKSDKGKNRKCPGFRYLSRLRFHECKLEKKKMASSARGDQYLEYYSIPGRAHFDAMQWYMSNYKVESYSLNDVAFSHTGEKKKDFAYKLIKTYFNGTPEQRREMAEYCIQDSEILRALLDMLKAFGDQIELSRVCYVLLERLTTHGQGIKVVSQLNFKCINMKEWGYEYDFIMNNHNIKNKERFVDDDSDDDEGYEGATVVNPITGYYEEEVIIVMDFSSLYPSIMIGDNLCKSTLVRRVEDRKKPGVVAYDIGAGGKHWKFVDSIPENHDLIEHEVLSNILSLKRDVTEKQWNSLNPPIKGLKMRSAIAVGEKYCIPTDGQVNYFTTKNKGILPAMLEETLSRRKIAKKEKEKAEARLDELKRLDELGTEEAATLKNLKLAFDKRQLALKVSANSAYGFMGAENGSYPDKAVAATVTSCGRGMLEESCIVCSEVAKTLTKKSDGQPVGEFKLVYGDTDSLMVTLSNVKNNPSDGHHAGVAMSGEVTKRFHARGHKSKKLEQEKCFHPWILFSKKKYSGIKYEEDHTGAIVSRGPSYSGTANKRRDSCKAVHNMYNAMIEPLLYKTGRDKCLVAFHSHMQDLISGKTLFENMVITKSLQSSYKNPNLAQCQVVKKQREREPGSETKPGGRLKMVYIQGPRNAKVGELAEDADYAKEKSLPLNLTVYIESQMKTPAISLLQHIVADPEALIKPYFDEAKRIASGTPRFVDFMKTVKPNMNVSTSSNVSISNTINDTINDTISTKKKVDKKRTQVQSTNITKWMKK